MARMTVVGKVRLMGWMRVTGIVSRMRVEGRMMLSGRMKCVLYVLVGGVEADTQNESCRRNEIACRKVVVAARKTERAGKGRLTLSRERVMDRKRLADTGQEELGHWER